MPAHMGLKEKLQISWTFLVINTSQNKHARRSREQRVTHQILKLKEQGIDKEVHRGKYVPLKYSSGLSRTAWAGASRRLGLTRSFGTPSTNTTPPSAGDAPATRLNGTCISSPAPCLTSRAKKLSPLTMTPASR
jgi:hypothetical protein